MFLQLCPTVLCEHNILPQILVDHLQHLSILDRIISAPTVHFQQLPGDLINHCSVIIGYTTALYISIANWLIQQYKLCGEYSCSINEHKFSHIPASIEYFGPPSIYWGFSFERKQGVFQSFRTISNGKQVQVTYTLYSL